LTIANRKKRYRGNRFIAVLVLMVITVTSYVICNVLAMNILQKIEDIRFISIETA